MVSAAAAQFAGAPHEAVDLLSGYRAAFLGAALIGLLASAVALVFVRGKRKLTEVPIG